MKVARIFFFLSVPLALSTLSSRLHRSWKGTVAATLKGEEPAEVAAPLVVGEDVAILGRSATRSSMSIRTEHCKREGNYRRMKPHPQEAFPDPLPSLLGLPRAAEPGAPTIE